MPQSPDELARGRKIPVSIIISIDEKPLSDSGF